MSWLDIPVGYFTLPSSRTFLLYLATSFALALVVHFRSARSDAGEGNAAARRSLLQELFPRAVYTHRSSLVDYVYFITNSILYASILVPFLGIGVYVSKATVSVFAWLWSPVAIVSLSAVSATILVTLLMALVADFGTFLGHYIMHKVPFLWEFHKVHHSAEVMTPMTVYRMHPVDDIFTIALGGILTGVVDGAIRFFITPAPSQYVLCGLSMVTFLFYLSGYNLRHSHTWLSYGPRLSKVLISPAQHQIHHSSAKRHWDKNFGFIFAIWDWMFGSLYVPTGYEQLKFGLGTGEESEYSSAVRLYVLPFVKIFRKSRRR